MPSNGYHYPDYHPVRTCVSCYRRARIVALDRCSRCYNRVRRSGSLFTSYDEFYSPAKPPPVRACVACYRCVRIVALDRCWRCYERAQNAGSLFASYDEFYSRRKATRATRRTIRSRRSDSPSATRLPVR